MNNPPSDWKQISDAGGGFISPAAIQLLEERDVAIADSQINGVPTQYFYTIGVGTALASGVSSATFKVPSPQWTGDENDWWTYKVLATWLLRTSSGAPGTIGNTTITLTHPDATLGSNLTLPTGSVGAHATGSTCPAYYGNLAVYNGLRSVSECNTTITIAGSAGDHWYGDVSVLLIPTNKYGGFVSI